MQTKRTAARDRRQFKAKSGGESARERERERRIDLGTDDTDQIKRRIHTDDDDDDDDDASKEKKRNALETARRPLSSPLRVL